MATKWQKNNTTLSKNTVNFGQEANLQPMCEKSGSKFFSFDMSPMACLPNNHTPANTYLKRK